MECDKKGCASFFAHNVTLTGEYHCRLCNGCRNAWHDFIVGSDAFTTYTSLEVCAAMAIETHDIVHAQDTRMHLLHASERLRVVAAAWVKEPL